MFRIRTRSTRYRLGGTSLHPAQEFVYTFQLPVYLIGDATLNHDGDVGVYVRALELQSGRAGVRDRPDRFQPLTDIAQCCTWRELRQSRGRKRLRALEQGFRSCFAFVSSHRKRSGRV